jgi:PAS domain S-box-containing protein
MLQAVVSSWKDLKDRAVAKMKDQSRPLPRPTSALLPVATAALATGIFIVDILTPPEFGVAVLYVAVVLMAARFCQPHGIVLVAAGCIGLTVVSYFASAETAINTAISIAAIGLTTFLALQGQSTEATLRERASLLDLTHDSIAARRFDDDVITYWSRGAEELYGWQRAEAVGRVASELRKNVPPLPLDQIKDELLRVGRWEGELVNNRSDGTPVLVTSRWSLQRDRRGRPTVMLVTSNDITDRKRAEQALRASEEQWREVFEHNPFMYFMVSPTGTVLSVNGFGAAQLGYTAAELIGGSVLAVLFEEDRELVKGQLAACVEEFGRSRSWEIRKIRKDGAVLWVRENAKAVRRSGNDVIVLIACEDITERGRGEQRVAAAYAVTRILAEADSLAAAAPLILGAIGESLEWDWGALCSFDREDAALRCDYLWHAPGIETGEFDTVSRERSFRLREGRLGQVWQTASPSWIRDATTEPEFLRAEAASHAGLHGGVIFPILLDAEALGVVEFFSRAARERDEEQLATLSVIGSQIGQFIKRRRAEAALRTSEERWRKLFETSSVGMGLFLLDGLCTAANPALQRMLGRAEEEVVGRNVLELNHEDERAATADALAQYRSGSLTERRVEKKYLKKDGSPVWLDITNTLVPATETAAPFLQAVYVDVTRRVQSEAALRASDERWRAIFESAAVGIATGDLDGGVLSMNPTFQRMLGYTGGEFRNLTVFEFTHEDDRAETRRFFSGIVTGQQTGYRLEKRYRRKDGATVWADVSASMVPATDTTPAFLAVMAVDTTDRKRAEDALRRSETYLNEVFLTLPDGVAIIGRDYRYQRVNPVYEDRTGLSCEQIVGMHVADINGVEAFNETIKPELDRSFAGEHVSYGRWSTRFAPGERYHAITYSPLFVSGPDQPSAVLAISRDLTEYMQASDALRQAQADLARLNRVMVLGEMTASIAHEINQPIAAVITNANAGLRWLGARPPDLDEVRQTLGRIVRDGTRAGEVIGGIRALVKKMPPRRELLDLNQTIREVVALTQTEMQRNGVRLQSRPADDLPLISADRIQLQQVLINLIVNAIEAMAGTSDRPRELKIVSGIDDPNDAFVEVQDTGPGLDSAEVDRLFHSFYTTKPEGIGMGLAISRSIIEAHGGRLSAAPNKPCGAVFRLTLPVEETPSGRPEQPLRQLS